MNLQDLVKLADQADKEGIDLKELAPLLEGVKRAQQEVINSNAKAYLLKEALTKIHRTAQNSKDDRCMSIAGVANEALIEYYK